MRPNKPPEWAGPLRFSAYALKLLPATQGQRWTASAELDLRSLCRRIRQLCIHDDAPVTVGAAEFSQSRDVRVCHGLFEVIQLLPIQQD
jgi:hypothetical protein